MGRTALDRAGQANVDPERVREDIAQSESCSVGSGCDDTREPDGLGARVKREEGSTWARDD
jgi:hypothetical protein